MPSGAFCFFTEDIAQELFNTGRILDLPGRSGGMCALVHSTSWKFGLCFCLYLFVLANNFIINLNQNFLTHMHHPPDVF